MKIMLKFTLLSIIFLCTACGEDYNYAMGQVTLKEYKIRFSQYYKVNNCTRQENQLAEDVQNHICSMYAISSYSLEEFQSRVSQMERYDDLRHLYAASPNSIGQINKKWEELDGVEAENGDVLIEGKNQIYDEKITAIWKFPKSEDSIIDSKTFWSMYYVYSPHSFDTFFNRIAEAQKHGLDEFAVIAYAASSHSSPQVYEKRFKEYPKKK